MTPSIVLNNISMKFLGDEGPLKQESRLMVMTELDGRGQFVTRRRIVTMRGAFAESSRAK